MIAAPLEHRASPAAPGVPLADLGEGPCWDPERQDGFLALDLDTRKVSVIAEVEADRPGNRMNDAACERTGRMFAGTKAEDDTPGAGSLYRLEPDHRLTTMLTGVTVLDYDPSTGAGGNRRPFAELPSGKLCRTAWWWSRRGCACSSCDELCVRRPVPGRAVHHDGCRAWQSHGRGRLVCVQAWPYRHASQSLPGLNAPGYAEVEVAHRGLSA